MNKFVLFSGSESTYKRFYASFAKCTGVGILWLEMFEGPVGTAPLAFVAGVIVSLASFSIQFKFH